MLRSARIARLASCEVAGMTPHHFDDVMELGEDDIMETHVSDVMGDLARLADGSGIPRLRGAIDWSELDQSEAWAVSLVAQGFTVKAIQAMSPLEEDTTTELLAKLITSRTIMMC